MGPFGKKPANGPPPVLPKAGGPKPESHFGRQLVIVGRISGQDNVTLHGSLDGDIDLTGHLVIGRHAVVEGNVTAESVTAGGKFSGTLAAGSILQIESGASIAGDVTTPRLTVQEGALFNGELKMGDRRHGGGADES
jgi:cytoskeletal protein CcmA (bactofilin family)